MPVIDSKGFIHFFKWKINIIDFLVVCLIVLFLPVGYLGYRVLLKKTKEQRIDELTKYEIFKKCPICLETIIIYVEKGSPPPQHYEAICPMCKNLVCVIGCEQPTKAKP